MSEHTDETIIANLRETVTRLIAERDELRALVAAAPELLQILIDLQESASYWSEYDVPLGIVDRINGAVRKATT